MAEATWHTGDVLTVLPTLEAGSVDLVLTSPPFLALRSYLPADHPDKALEGGSQATPGAYVDWLIDVVEALDRVLALHGSMVIELGDTYAGSGGAGGDDTVPGNLGYERYKDGARYNAEHRSPNKRAAEGGWPLDKSLTLIPELFRLTLVYGTNPLTGRQTEPWRLRNIIRWVRPNPPVGALGDKFRPATTELAVFCKARDRYFDLDAVREPAQGYPNHPSNGPKAKEREGLGIDGVGRYAKRIDSHAAGAPPLDWWNISTYPYKGAHYATFPPELCVKPIKAMCPERVCRECGEPSRRISTVGSIDTIGRVLREARQAKELSQRDVAEWFPSVTGGLTGCVWNWENGANVPMGWQWDRLKRELDIGSEYDHLLPDRESVEYRHLSDNPSGLTQNAKGELIRKLPATKNKIPPSRFTDCGHNNWRPGLVLDPFAGTGTTLAVATGHSRDAIGIDLDERNADLAEQRIGPLFFRFAESVL